MVLFGLNEVDDAKLLLGKLYRLSKILLIATILLVILFASYGTECTEYN